MSVQFSLLTPLCVKQHKKDLDRLDLILIGYFNYYNFKVLMMKCSFFFASFRRESSLNAEQSNLSALLHSVSNFVYANICSLIGLNLTHQVAVQKTMNTKYFKIQF